MILIAALGFAAVSASTADPEPQQAVAPEVLPASLSARIAAAGLSTELNPEFQQPRALQPEPAEVAVAPAAAPAAESTTTTTVAPTTTTAPPVTTTTTSPPATTTTAPPATTTTAPPATTTTAEPPPTTTTTTPPGDGGSRDVEEWRPLVAQYFPADLVDGALSVMRCESLGDPLAYNSRHGASGLYQFIPSTWAWASAEAGFGGASPFEPEANIGAAAWLVRTSINQGKTAWAHWSCKP